MFEDDTLMGYAPVPITTVLTGISKHCTVIQTVDTVPTKLLGTPPYFQCILMALRVLEKCNNS
jgi:hypothetical protein